MNPVASTRMYNVAPGAVAAWRRVVAWVAARSGVPLAFVEHAHPAPLASLWARPDLACGFMCGWPLAQEGGERTVLAAPVPAGERLAQYRSVFVVAAGSGLRTLADCFGTRLAFNARSSHSGWNMPMAHVRRLGGAFAAEVGPFGPHQLAAAAVADGAAEVAALDSLVWALLERHDPGLAARLRVVGQTPADPAPPLVGEPGTAAALRGALLGMAADPKGRALLADVCLAGFAPASLRDYDVLLP